MSWETALDNRIHDYLPDLKWVENEPMAKHTSFRIGGPAKRMAFPKTREQLVVLMGFLQDAGVKPLLIGNGSFRTRDWIPWSSTRPRSFRVST